MERPNAKGQEGQGGERRTLLGGFDMFGIVQNIGTLRALRVGRPCGGQKSKQQLKDIDQQDAVEELGWMVTWQMS